MHSCFKHKWPNIFKEYWILRGQQTQVKVIQVWQSWPSSGSFDHFKGANLFIYLAMKKSVGTLNIVSKQPMPNGFGQAQISSHACGCELLETACQDNVDVHWVWHSQLFWWKCSLNGGWCSFLCKWAVFLKHQCTGQKIPTSILRIAFKAYTKMRCFQILSAFMEEPEMGVIWCDPQTCLDIRLNVPIWGLKGLMDMVNMHRLNLDNIVLNPSHSFPHSRSSFPHPMSTSLI